MRHIALLTLPAMVALAFACSRDDGTATTRAAFLRKILEARVQAWIGR